MLEEQLQELQAALLASILDMDEYRRGYRSSGSGPASPLEWSDGLLLLHTCPAPLDRHLLGLLGRPKVSAPPPLARLGLACLALRSVSSMPRPLPGSGIHLILLSALSCTRLICSPSGGEGGLENKASAIFCKGFASTSKPLQYQIFTNSE